MSELTPKNSNKNKIIIGLLVVVVLGGGCLCVGGAVAIPAFMRYVNKSKAAEAKMNVSRIASGAKSHFELSDDCAFPESAGPLPPLQDCCAEVCRREEAQTQDPGWEQVGFDTLGMYRYTYETTSDGSRYVVRATGDLDCDGHTSEFVVEVTGERQADGTCLATVGSVSEENPVE